MSDKGWIENLHDRPMVKMKPGETLYAQRLIAGFSHHFFGALVRIDKGTVIIRGKWIDRLRYEDKEQIEERFRVDRCFLWGKERRSGHTRCHWFKRGKNFPAE